MMDARANEAWPSGGLEHVPACPVCGGVEHHLLLGGLTDDVFRTAPGQWQLQQCEKCQSAFLDPRPTMATIGQAYGNYYPHQATPPREAFEAVGVLRKLRRLVSNGYTNTRYGTQYRPAMPLIGRLAGMIPKFVRNLDAQHRWLPRPSGGKHLLDVGCGNGDFLAIARSAGWLVYGVDPDPEAVACAASRGMHVRTGDITAFSDAGPFFDAITLNHCIEHVHHPRELVRTASGLLVDGGTLFVETPNICSRGREAFGRHWRGLEAPRHLVLFNLASLSELLASEGFTNLRIVRRPEVARVMAGASLQIAAGASPYAAESAALQRRARAWAGARQPAERLEFLTILASRSRR